LVFIQLGIARQTIHEIREDQNIQLPFESTIFGSLDPKFEKMIRTQECGNFKISKLDRNAGKFGFHRDLITSIIFSLPEEETNDCTLLLVENLSESIYIDKFQIEDEERLSAKLQNREHPKIRMKEEMDVEKPVYHPNLHPAEVLVFQNVTQRNVTITIPIHFRYQTPSIEPYTLLSIPPPKIWINCKFRLNISDWNPLCYETNKNHTINILIPNGLLQHEQLVTYGTFFITSLAAAVIIYFLYKY